MAWPTPSGRSQSLGGVVKAVRASHNPNTKAVGRSQGSGVMGKAVGTSPRSWRRGRGRGGVAKDVEAWSRSWGHDQGRGGVAKALETWPRP